MKKDVVIVGGGPAGASSAMFLMQQGISAVIVEQQQFPRYHIGESLTGGSGAVLRSLGLEKKMIDARHPTKQGVKVYGRSTRGSWFVPVTGRDENWELFIWDTWQVRRSDFDKMMLEEAIGRGATFLTGKATRPLVNEDGSVRGVQVRMADGGTMEIESEVLLDCSGQATWLANLGRITGPKYLGAYDKQIAIFSQVAGAIRDEGTSKDADREKHKDNTLILYQQKFHWAWFIPLDDDVVSVGVVVPAAYFLEKKESKREFYLRELREMHPELKRRIPEIKLVEDIHVIPNYSYQVKGFCGKGFICVGDAHRFIDPIFSFGVTAGMQEAQFGALAIKAYLEGAHRDAPNPFAEHEIFCEKGIDILEDTIDLFWEQPLAFAVAVHRGYTAYMTDVFAGRVYERQPSLPILSFRRMLGRAGERERSYREQDLYSMPIGSRFHPERAPLWEANAVIESTEEWIGPR